MASDELRIAWESLDELTQRSVKRQSAVGELPSTDLLLLRLMLVVSELCGAVENLERTEHRHYPEKFYKPVETEQDANQVQR